MMSVGCRFAAGLPPGYRRFTTGLLPVYRLQQTPASLPPLRILVQAADIVVQQCLEKWPGQFGELKKVAAWWSVVVE
jgi:hypothetical protein